MRYARKCWYVAGWEQDLEPGKPMAIDILGEPIAIYPGESGRLVALEDRCVHRLAQLSLGRCEAGDRLRCLYHGMLYDPDGKVVEIPGQDTIPPKARVRAYPVVAKHSWIWVWMGDAAAADEALIPPAVGFDDPNWILGRGHLDYDAEARLINDNLLDFTHLPFVHSKSFGIEESYGYELPEIRAVERGVRFNRWATRRRRMVEDQDIGPCDVYSTYDFLLPGILLMWSGVFPAGTGEALNNGTPDFSKAIADVTFTSQAVTPMSGRKSRYFFSWGPHRDHGDEAMRDILMGIADMAFNEDKAVIEAQQRVIDKTPAPQIMPTAADRGVTLFNRLVDKLVREEEAGTRGTEAAA
jgi:phenylpropionate dioxygenase-like ring-hydroxylating dioxygenase large terminal subunit